MPLIDFFSWTNIDIIGDVHGEIGALGSLLHRLQYDGNGYHPEGRKLIFVGDLVDRGPDSLAVLYLVKHFVEQGNAKCVLGNHELNLLIPDPKNTDPNDPTPKQKTGNHWFHSLPEAMIDDNEAIQFQRLAGQQDRQEIQTFLQQLPLVLENSHCRIVHACWNEEVIKLLKDESRSVLEIYHDFQQQILLRAAASNADKITKELHKQNDNPIKVITSGIESRLSKDTLPYMAGKKLRHLKRVPWWRNYTGKKHIFFGHYWRRGPLDPTTPIELLNPQEKSEVPILFTERLQDWLGPKGNCMCIDYSVGRRFWERHNGLMEGQTGSFLAALQVFQQEDSFSYKLLFDNGTEIVLPS